MTQQYIAIWVKNLIKTSDLHSFYISTQWLKVRAEVLNEQHNECQICKGKKLFKPATTVHHINYVRNVPRLALSKVDELGNPNLLAVCDECHYAIHHKADRFHNTERW